jgi:hypothetical protein
MELRDDLGHLPNGAVADIPLQTSGLGMKRKNERLPEQRIRRGYGEQIRDLVGVDAERLLAEHGAARRDGSLGPPNMLGVGHGDVDRVGVGAHGVGVGHRGGDLVVGGPGRRTLRIPTAYGDRDTTGSPHRG